jgi:SAM-dependent methyltransferase
VTSREQRLVFGEDPELYDRVRPGYADGAVDRVVALAPGPRFLESGAGTGKLTRQLVARGVDVHCVEPDEAMAGVLAARCPDVEIAIGGFEDWSAAPGSFDAVAAGQSWHWVRPGVRTEVAARALRTAGIIGLLWNVPEWQRTPLREALDRAYEKHAPEVGARGAGGVGGIRHDVADPYAELEVSTEFDAPVHERYTWEASYDAAAWCELLATSSDHRLLDPSVRERLLRAVRDVIDGHGGSFVLTYETHLLWARRN